jgi:UDP:flavonoid glycosyltransferase YjiC (YdhE family)
LRNRVPQRFISPRPLRLAVEQALEEPSIRARARELAAWASSHDAGAAAATLVEKLAECDPSGVSWTEHRSDSVAPGA